MDRRDAPIAKEMIETVWSKLNDNKTIELLAKLIETSSPTGSESPAAELLATFMEEHGIKVQLQEVEDGRHNVIGTVPGYGSGPRVLFNGHLDASFTGNFREDFAMAAELAHVMKPKATIEDGFMYGLGARNMKAGVASMTAALCALADSGLKLRGDVLVAGVVGEIERSPVQGLLHNYEGKAFRGCGVGMKYLLDHGITADFGITTEPTSNKVDRATGGFIYVKLITRGHAVYAPRKSSDSRGKAENAILKMSRIVAAIEDEFAPTFTKSHTYNLGPEDGIMEPQVNVGGIEGGYPFKPNYVPAICYSYVALYITPKMNAKQVIEELRVFLDKKGFNQGHGIEVEPYVIRGPATETPADNYLVSTCRRIYEYTSGEKHTLRLSNACISTDANTTRLYGIPSVTCGPSGTSNPKAVGRGEFVSIEDVVRATRMHAAAMVEICRTKKEELAHDVVKKREKRMV